MVIHSLSSKLYSHTSPGSQMEPKMVALKYINIIRSQNYTIARNLQKNEIYPISHRFRIVYISCSCNIKIKISHTA